MPQLLRHMRCPSGVETFLTLSFLFSLDLSVLKKLGARGDRSLTGHTNVDSLGDWGGGGYDALWKWDFFEK